MRSTDTDFPEQYLAAERKKEAERDNKILSEFIRELSKPDLQMEELVVRARRLA